MKEVLEQTDYPKKNSDENFNLLEKFKSWVKKIRQAEFSEDSEKSEKGEIAEKFLTSSDEYIFKKGLEILYNHLDQKEAERLPKVLFFPETSARVLAYVVMPVIDYLYKKNGVPNPEFVFIKTSKQNTEKPIDEDKDNLKKRIVETYKQYDLHQGTRGLIIDDFIAKSHTVDKIKEAIKEIDKDAKIEAFAFIAENPGEDAENVYLSGADLWKGQALISFLDKKNSDFKEQITGVTKSGTEDEAYVRMSENKNRFSMRKIRKELSELGKDFLNEIHKKHKK